VVRNFEGSRKEIKEWGRRWKLATFSGSLWSQQRRKVPKKAKNGGGVKIKKILNSNSVGGGGERRVKGGGDAGEELRRGGGVQRYIHQRFKEKKHGGSSRLHFRFYSGLKEIWKEGNKNER